MGRTDGGEISGGYEGALRLLDGAAPERRPTGLFCYNDRVTAGVLHAATALLHRAMGEAAARLLLDAIDIMYRVMPPGDVQMPHCR